MAITVPSDKRFLRAQIHTPKRRRLRLRPIVRVVRILVVGGVLVVGGYWAAHSAAGLHWLRVQHLSVSGNQRLSTGEITLLVEGLKGDSLLATDLDRWRARLLASPWIADATLRRRLPGTIEIDVRERKPLGLARVGHDLQLIDGTGTIDAFGPRYADLDLPIIDGLVINGGSPKPRIDAARAHTVGRFLADLRTRPALSQRVSQIDVSDAHDLHVILDGDSAVIRLGDALFADRLQVYVDLQATLRERVPEIDYVDLRFGERVYVGPARSSANGITRPVTTTPARDPGERPQR